jgi:cytochrome bd-type quinol oxidase subunit 1
MSKSKAQKHRAHQPHGQTTTAKATTAAPANRHRSGLITAVIILVLLHGVLFTLLAWSDLRTNGVEERSLYMPLLLITSVADVIAAVALWYWKNWGFQLYVASTLVMATSALMNTGSILVLFASILPAIIVAYIYLPKQRLFD